VGTPEGEQKETGTKVGGAPHPSSFYSNRLGPCLALGLLGNGPCDPCPVLSLDQSEFDFQMPSAVVDHGRPTSVFVGVQESLLGEGDRRLLAFIGLKECMEITQKVYGIIFLS
jgi:hypothetical protein